MNPCIAPRFFSAVLVAVAVLLFLQFGAFSGTVSAPNTAPKNNQAAEIKQNPTDEKGSGGPTITFASTQYYFGRVTSGDSPRIDFSFKNSGEEPLVILEVKGG